MYTQCPKCETVFHITMEQLQAHSGMVRCGQCDHVFNADQRLFDDIPDKAAPKPTPAKKSRGATGTAAKPKPVKPKTETNAAPTPSRKPVRTAKKPSSRAAEKAETAPAARPAATKPQKSARVEPRLSTQPYESELEFEALPWRPARRRFSSLWFLGILALIAVLAVQTIFFYRDQLAAYPQWRPHLIAVCAEIGCTLRPPYDAGRIELVQPTNIAPHPRFSNALRLRATLVNRADKAQPPPLMQVTLTDSGGRVLSRRTFAPAQYMEQRRSAGADMPPHLAIGALLDLANPDGKAVGYQIDFFSPPIH